MNFNTSDYFAYKKNKIQMEVEKQKKPMSKVNFLFQLFMATFIIMFIVIVVAIMKYSSKMDIEYTKGELSLSSANVNNISGYGTVTEDVQRKIDKRLMLIQQEENAPSEARIIKKDKNNVEVIDPSHIEKNKKIEKLEKQKEQNLESESKDKKLASALEEIIHTKKSTDNILETEKNVTVLSKVLIGRFNTFEDAQKLQNDIKAKDSSLSPFVRKVGEVYSVQMGSFQDFSVAKKQAQMLRTKGFDVWIYQQ